MPGQVWEYTRAARLVALRARMAAVRDRWSRERRGCADPAERLRITAKLGALGKRIRRMTFAAKAEGIDRPGAAES